MAALANVFGNETDGDYAGMEDREYFSTSPLTTPLPEEGIVIPVAECSSEENLQVHMAAMDTAGADQTTPGLAIERVAIMLKQQRQIEQYCGVPKNISRDVYNEVQEQAGPIVRLRSLLNGMLEARMCEIEFQANRRASVHVAVQMPSSSA